MPTTTRLRSAVPAAMLLLLVALAGCDGTTVSPPASPSPSVADACGTDEIAASGIDGSVVDSDGNPLNDIFLQIDTGDGFRGTARTTEDGAWSAPGVSGEFVITTVDIAYDSVTQRVTVPCGETVEVELVLTPTGE